MWRGLVLCLVLPLMALADDPPAAASAADSPAGKMLAAQALLAARGSYRETRVFSKPEPFTMLAEFSGKRQRWISEHNDDGERSREETIWEGGRSASRTLPGSPGWSCNPPIDEKYIEPEHTVTDGGKVIVNGRAAHRYIEKFKNEMNQSDVTHLVDVDDATGLPLQLTSTEVGSHGETRYVGTYYDIGVPFEIEFPDCQGSPASSS